MNLKFEQIKKSKKHIINLVLIVIVFFVGFQVIKHTFAKPDGDYLKDQIVDNISFDNATLDVNEDTSKFEVEVTNLNDSNYSLSTISIIFKDINKNEIITLQGYIGNKLKTGETKILTASVDMLITDIYSIDYVINK